MDRLARDDRLALGDEANDWRWVAGRRLRPEGKQEAAGVDAEEDGVACAAGVAGLARTGRRVPPVVADVAVGVLEGVVAGAGDEAGMAASTCVKLPAPIGPLPVLVLPVGE